MQREGGRCPRQSHTRTAPAARGELPATTFFDTYVTNRCLTFGKSRSASVSKIEFDSQFVLSAKLIRSYSKPLPPCVLIRGTQSAYAILNFSTSIPVFSHDDILESFINQPLGERVNSQITFLG